MDDDISITIHPKGRVAQSFDITPEDVVDQIQGSKELQWRVENGNPYRVIHMTLTSSEGFNARITITEKLDRFVKATRKLLREEGII